MGMRNYTEGIFVSNKADDYTNGINMDVLLNGLSISAKGKLQSLCCMMGKTMSFRCHLLAANGWRLIH